MVKVLFIYPNLTGQECIHNGIAILSACAKERGHETFLMDYAWGGSKEDCLRKIKQVNPQLIAFTVNSGDYNFCLSLADKIKQVFDIPIIFGGVYPTVNPQEVIKQESVDIICRGEGEEALVELLDKIGEGKDYTKTKSLWVKRGNEIIKNPLRPFIDIEKLPFLDVEIYDYKKYLESSNGKMNMMAGRGCPFSCSYCTNSFNRKTFKGKYVRFRSPRQVVDEILLLKKKYPMIRLVSFFDDVFTSDKKWLKKFCELYIKEVKLPFHCLSRAETINDEVCSYLKKTGCTVIRIGVESGSKKIRHKVLKRYTTNEQIINAFKCARKHGINTYSYNIVGIPFETKEDYWNTIKLNRIIKPTHLQSTVFMPYYGTEIYNICLDKGFLKKDTFIENNHNCFSILEYPDVSKREIHRRRKYFRFRVFRTYDLKKALIILPIDSLFFTYYWALRPRLPLIIKKAVFKFKLMLSESQDIRGGKR